ncbi:hypothetical protein DES52_104301 [Deinococcus yavapaiensis KR-236]|uniref:Uncharacterized protein n=1 Tax=Deinococcus yavapaiensis KR-236 TaxID=694435 RepID=A0A318S7Y2_9DEIO|nr:hypothetical protein DES52_104301 [Deinococcus yavapaiensis KR-236]
MLTAARVFRVPPRFQGTLTSTNATRKTSSDVSWNKLSVVFPRDASPCAYSRAMMRGVTSLMWPRSGGVPNEMSGRVIPT